MPKKKKSRLKVVDVVGRKPLWDGPMSDSEQGGISQSLFGRWLCCRERFRLLTVEGLKEEDSYNHKMEYGNMWQICEEYHAGKKPWKSPLLEYVRAKLLEYPNKADQINKWYNVCKIQFPIYVDHWREHADYYRRKPLKQEWKFHTPYELPSGRIVWLRGMMDEVFKMSKKIWLQENKAKGDVNEEAMKFELPFQLQTMFYDKVLRLEVERGSLPDMPVAGVAYNVIRRPLSDWQGRFNIKQRQGRLDKKTGQRKGQESDKEFYERLGDLIKENKSHFFMRWKAVISQGDTDKFVKQFLDPCLEEMCDWWQHIELDPFDPWSKDGNGIHWRMPYGVYNPLLLGRQTEYAHFLHTGSDFGMQRVSSLFRELDPPEPVSTA